MGRKQKLRKERRGRKKKELELESAPVSSPVLSPSSLTVSSSSSTTTLTPASSSTSTSTSASASASASTSTSTSTTTLTLIPTSTSTSTSTSTLAIGPEVETSTTDSTNDNDNANVNAIVKAALMLAADEYTWASYVESTDKIVLDSEFPKSDPYIQWEIRDKNKKEGDDMKESMYTFIHSALRYGCMHSMFVIGSTRSFPELNEELLHLAQPWYLEGAIRGSLHAVHGLVSDIYPLTQYEPKALMGYWLKMQSKYEEWSVNSKITSDRAQRKEIQGCAEEKCAVCENNETLKLRRCMGCRLCCYCSNDCQTHHWAMQNHRSECKQVQILNKYHKPYAKEIVEASIRGETTSPVLERLRDKLGLTRPVDDYERLLDLGTSHEGVRLVQLHPAHFLTAREDGTVWVGSIPNQIGPSFDSKNSTTNTPRISNRAQKEIQLPAWLT